MSKKVLLWIAALLVVAMIVGLMISVRSGVSTSSAGPAESPGAAPGREAIAAGDSAPPPRATGATAPPATPVSPEIKRPEPVAPVEGDTGTGTGIEVRDHRGAGPTGPPSPLKSTTIAAVRQALEPQVRACADGLSIENTTVRFVAHSTLRAGGGRITSYGMRVTGAEALGPKFADCVGRAYAKLSADVGDEQADGEDTVHMPWTIP